MESIRQRATTYWAFLLMVVGFSIPCQRTTWHGSAELQTLAATISTLLAGVAGAIALKGYYTTKIPTYLLLGSGLVGSSLLDGYHAVISSSFWVGDSAPALNALTAWSGTTPRVFLSLFLCTRALTEPENRLVRRIGEWGVYALLGVSILGTFLVFALVPARLALYPRVLVHRTEELIPPVCFALAALAHLRKGAWKTEGFEYWLILSLIAAAAGDLFCWLLSRQVYDAPFFFFHMLKNLSFVLLLAGLFSSVSSIFRSEADAVLQLRHLNEALAGEIDEREQVEEQLRRSRDELETRVQERTADLQEQSQLVRAAHVETELFLTSIPSILIGIDPQGRITRWNPTACETFGITADSALGRTLDDCGIRWLTPDMPAEVSRWLLTDALYRCDDLTYERDGSARTLGLCIRPVPSLQKEAARFLITGTDITERKRAEAALAQLAAIVQSCDAAIVGADLAGRILSWNAAAERVYGYSLEEVKDRPVSMLWPPERTQELLQVLRRLNHGESIRNVESIRVKKDGQRIPVMISYSPVRDGSGRIVSICSIATDITDRKFLERQLVQAQKLESIGQLAAGIAHEINTPIQYVGDNIQFLRDSFARLEPLFEGYDQLLALVRSELPAAPSLPYFEALATATRATFLRTEVPKSIEDSIDGAARVAEIVRAMKEFSHPGPAEKMPLDINRAIESTVLVSRNEWKYVADLNVELDPNLPPIACVPGEFNQVVLNLIVNAAHSIADVVSSKPDTKGAITVSTHLDGDWAEIRVRDTGTGIPEEVQASVFNPFFTTKGIGKGTGQGLAIAHAVIVQKHGGTISFDTTVGVGTVFRVRLPIGGATTGTDDERPCRQPESALLNGQAQKTAVFDD